MKVADILTHIESFAPLGLALSWDNVGLLMGDRDWDVTRAYVCLDVTPTAVEQAIMGHYDVIISHHPLVFRPVKNITNPLFIRLIQNRIAVICLHTNLDVAKVSVNHILAERLGMEVLFPLSYESGSNSHSITVYSPPEAAERISKAAWEAGAGAVGNYNNCASSYEVTGYFTAGKGCNPYCSGANGVRELALLFVCDSIVLNKVLLAIKQAHPYETPLLVHHPLESHNPDYGLGLVCQYPQPHNLGEIAQIIVDKLACPQLKLWLAGSNKNTVIERVAICGGSGGTLINAAESKAQLFISGDISYHSFLDSRIPIIDAGHFYTEYPVLDYLAKQLDTLDLQSTIMPVQQHEYYRNMVMQ